MYLPVVEDVQTFSKCLNYNDVVFDEIEKEIVYFFTVYGEKQVTLDHCVIAY